MKVKQNVRQRRQERLKSLMERQDSPSSLSRREEWMNRSEPAFSEPGPGRYADAGAQAIDPRMEDPEYVWKLKQKTLGWGLADPDEIRSAQSSSRWREWSQRPTLGQFRFKIVLCVFIYAAVWGLFQIDQPWAAKAQTQIGLMFTQDFQFDRAAVWYKSHFQGFPSLIPVFHPTEKGLANPEQPLFYPPIKGAISRAFRADDSGILIQTPDTEVKALTAGRVTFSGWTEDSGLTVVIRHADELQSVYGMLQTAAVQPNDWVEGGDVIAGISPGTAGTESQLFFAVKRHDRFVNPAEVISFD